MYTVEFYRMMQDRVIEAIKANVKNIAGIASIGYPTSIDSVICVTLKSRKCQVYNLLGVKIEEFFIR